MVLGYNVGRMFKLISIGIIPLEIKVIPGLVYFILKSTTRESRVQDIIDHLFLVVIDNNRVSGNQFLP